MAGAFSFSGMSVMSTSVVRIIAAMEAAFSSAPRTKTLTGIDHTSLDHVGVFAGEDVVADVRVLLLGGGAADGVDDDGAILTSVGSQLADRGFERLLDDVDADLDLFFSSSA
jgi:hypothetical protein